jgi:hypothetical protein
MVKLSRDIRRYPEPIQRHPEPVEWYRVPRTAGELVNLGHTALYWRRDGMLAREFCQLVRGYRSSFSWKVILIIIPHLMATSAH